MILPVALSFLSLAYQTPCSGPALTNLVSSFPYGEQLAMALTPDQSRAFVAEGAAITFLSMPSSPWATAPTVIEKFPWPYAQPLALKYFHSTGTTPQDWLFIAGGAMGLWAVPLCTGLFATPPAPCGTYVPVELDTIGGGYFESKRCLALAIDPSSTVLNGTPVLYALFGASDLPAESAIGPTELRAYSLSGSTFPLIAEVNLQTIATTPQRAQRGTALAIDPGTHDAVYVAMGKGGIHQAKLNPGSPATLSEFVIWTPPAQGIEVVRDLSIVRTTIAGTSRAFLYAALNYGSVLEYELTGTHSTQVTTLSVCGFPEAITTTLNGSTVYVSVAVDVANGKYDDTAAPYTVNGIWRDICLEVGAVDPDAPVFSPSCERKLVLFSRDLSGSSGPLTQTAATTLPSVGPSSWNALVMPNPVPASTFPLYMNSGFYGTQIWSVNTTTLPWTTTVLQTYVGKGFGATDATVSLKNPGVVRFGLENAGAVVFDGYLAYIDPQSPYSTYIIPGTKYECPNGYYSPSCCGSTTNPGAFGGGIMAESHWLDPDTHAPQREWFLVGRPSKQRFSDVPTNCPGGCSVADVCSHCLTTSDCSTNPWYPCDPANPLYFAPHTYWRPGELPSMLGQGDTGSWQLIAHTLPAQGLPVVSTIDPRWEQIALQKATSTTGPIPSEVRANSVTLSHSIVDPRMTPTGYPRAVYAVRQGTNYGLQVFEPESLSIMAQGSTSTCDPLHPWPGGYGEQFNETTVRYKRVFTRIDLELDANHNPLCSNLNDTACSGQRRALFGNRADIYQTPNGSGGTAYVLAIAAGFPVCQAVTGQGTGCLWQTYYGRPMLVLYDITNTGDGTFGSPALLRVAIGTDKLGSAFAVKTKAYGSGSTARTYAFVLDVLGMLYVFDVTGDKVFPKAVASQPYLPSNRVLPVASRLQFPKDPYDGLYPNGLDLELDGTYLYCALGRGGVGVVDVSNALAPTLCAVLDTPGITEGLTLRTVGTSPPHKQLIVCDTRCGVRVYQ